MRPRKGPSFPRTTVVTVRASTASPWTETVARSNAGCQLDRDFHRSGPRLTEEKSAAAHEGLGDSGVFHEHVNSVPDRDPASGVDTAKPNAGGGTQADTLRTSGHLVPAAKLRHRGPSEAGDSSFVEVQLGGSGGQLQFARGEPIAFDMRRSHSPADICSVAKAPGGSGLGMWLSGMACEPVFLLAVVRGQPPPSDCDEHHALQGEDRGRPADSLASDKPAARPCAGWHVPELRRGWCHCSSRPSQAQSVPPLAGDVSTGGATTGGASTVAAAV